MRRLFEWLGFVRPQVDPLLHPMVMMMALTTDGSVGFINESASPTGTDSLSLQPQAPTEFAKAERRFREELPGLLQEPERRGHWVVYTSRGCVAESCEEASLRDKYGPHIGKTHFLARVVPDPPEAEVTLNWFVTVER